ncbi:hypothetical protein LXL04_011876 [Taraxacum kok-saghyz]
MWLPLPRSADENAPLLRLFPSPSAVFSWYLRRSLFSISISVGSQIFSVTFLPVGIGTPIGCGSLISSSVPIPARSHNVAEGAGSRSHCQHS